MSKVLGVLISINVQAKPDINLGGQGMIITNQGVAIQLCLSKDGIELAVFVAFGEVLSFGLGGRGTGPRSLAHSTAR